MRYPLFTASVKKIAVTLPLFNSGPENSIDQTCLTVDPAPMVNGGMVYGYARYQENDADEFKGPRGVKSFGCVMLGQGGRGSASCSQASHAATSTLLPRSSGS
ncbi:hypothetical protein ACLBWH_11095 [Sphingomonas sp. M6A6_1c]